MTIRGSCLCGKVSFEINGKVSDIGQCHCSKCRKATGTAHAATLVTAKRSFRWLLGESHVRTYATDTGYDTAFCNVCGSPVPKLRNGKVFMVPVGALDDDPGVRPVLHASVASKAPWFELYGDLPQHDERPLA